MTSAARDDTARVVPLRPAAPTERPAEREEPLWRDVVGEVLRDVRLDQDRTLKDVAEDAGISMPYLSEIERGRKEASSEILAAAARALGLDLAGLLALSHRRLTSLTRVTRVGGGSAGHGPAPKTATRPAELCLAA